VHQTVPSSIGMEKPIDGSSNWGKALDACPQVIRKKVARGSDVCEHECNKGDGGG